MPILSDPAGRTLARHELANSRLHGFTLKTQGRHGVAATRLQDEDVKHLRLHGVTASRRHGARTVPSTSSGPPRTSYTRPLTVPKKPDLFTYGRYVVDEDGRTPNAHLTALIYSSTFSSASIAGPEAEAVTSAPCAGPEAEAVSHQATRFAEDVGSGAPRFTAD